MSRTLVLVFVCLATFSLFACTAAKEERGNQSGKYNGDVIDDLSDYSTEIPKHGPDSGSFANFDVYKTTSMELSLEIDTAARSFRMRGSVNIHYEKQIQDSQEPLFLDMLGLKIKKVEVSYDGGISKSKVNFIQHRHLPNNGGAALEIAVDSGEAEGVVIVEYVVGTGSTDQHSYHLMENTTLRYVAYSSQQDYPILATFNRPNMARSWIPCQDSIHVKSKVKMVVRVPQPFTALMSGLLSIRDDDQTDDTTTFEYDQHVPVAAQQLTLTMGYFRNTTVSDRITVWSEAQTEFRDREDLDLGHDGQSLLKICEGMVGLYIWGQLNLVLLPDQLGYNSERLGPNTVYIPLALVQHADSPVNDRSLVRQELARQMFLSWFGDLVTPTHRDSWLSEGIAQYLSYYATAKAMDNGRHFPEFFFYYSRMDLNKNDLVNVRGPDGLMDKRAMIAQRGALRMKYIEKQVGGKSNILLFLRVYIVFHVFDSVSNEDFVDLLGKVFPGVDIDWDRLSREDEFDFSMMAELSDPGRYAKDVEQVFLDWTRGKPAMKLGSQLKQLKTVQLAYLLDHVRFVELEEEVVKPLTRKFGSLLKKIGIYSDEYMFSRWAHTALTLGDETIVNQSLKYVAKFERTPAARAIFNILSRRAEEKSDNALKMKLKKVTKKIKESSFVPFN